MLVERDQSFQQLNGLSVINHHPFGADLHFFALSNAHILNGSQYMGCGSYPLAAGLAAYFVNHETEIVGVVDQSKSKIVHVALEIKGANGPVYLDADGLANRDELLYKMEHLEHRTTSRIITLPKQFHFPKKDVRKITDALFKTFGEPSPQLLDLNCILNTEQELGQVFMQPAIKADDITALELRLLEDLGVKVQRVITTDGEQLLSLFSRADVSKYSKPTLSINDMDNIADEDRRYLAGDKLKDNIGLTSILRQIVVRSGIEKITVYKRGTTTPILNIHRYGVLNSSQKVQPPAKSEGQKSQA